MVEVPKYLTPTSFLPLSLFNPTPNSPMLPLILPTHPRLISRPLTPFPKARSSSLPPNNPIPTFRTILRPINTLPTTPTTNHSFCPLINMFFFLIMTLITRVYFLTATESKPTVTFAVMSTATVFGERCTWGYAERLFLFSREEICSIGGGYLQKFDCGD